MAVSEAKCVANRQNALKSTGPRSAEGKARAAMNAVKHGLCASSVVVPGEDAEAFEVIREQVMREYNPKSIVEMVLVTQLAQAAWRMSRLAGAEAKAIQFCMNRKYGPVLDAAGALMRDVSSMNSQLNRLQIYQMRQERAFYRALAELRKVRKEMAEREEEADEVDMDVDIDEQTNPTPPGVEAEREADDTVSESDESEVDTSHLTASEVVGTEVVASETVASEIDESGVEQTKPNTDDVDDAVTHLGPGVGAEFFPQNEAEEERIRNGSFEQNEAKSAGKTGVILSRAKYLFRDQCRFFAALRMTVPW